MSGVVNAIRPLLTMRMAVWMRLSLPSVYQATYCPPSVMTRTGWFMSSAFRRRTTATPVTMFDGSTNGFHGSPVVGRKPPADECDQGEQADDRQCGLPCQQGYDDQDE